MPESDAQPQIVENSVSPVDIAVEAGLAGRWNRLQTLLAQQDDTNSPQRKDSHTLWEQKRNKETRGNLFNRKEVFLWSPVPNDSKLPLGMNGQETSGMRINSAGRQIVEAGRQLGPEMGKQLLYTTTGREMFGLMLQIADGRLDPTIKPDEWTQAETAMNTLSSLIMENQGIGAEPGKIEELMGQLMPDDDPKWQIVVQTLYAEGQLMAVLAKHFKYYTKDEVTAIMQGPLNLQRKVNEQTINFTGKERAKRVGALRRLKVSAKEESTAAEVNEEPSPEHVEQMRQKINEVFTSNLMLNEADNLDLIEAVSFKDLNPPTETSGIDPATTEQWLVDSMQLLVENPDVAKQLIGAVYELDADKVDAFMTIVQGALLVTKGLDSLNQPANFRGPLKTAIETCLGQDWKKKARAASHPNNSN